MTKSPTDDIASLTSRLEVLEAATKVDPDASGATEVQRKYLKFASAAGGDSLETIVRRCSEISNRTAQLGIINSSSYYLRLLDGLQRLKNANFVSLEDIGKSNDTGKLNVALRHDVDADIGSAIDCADALQKRGIPGTFYLLHTSHYFSQITQADPFLVFTYHDGFVPLLQRLVETGVDIGLHNDALGVEIDHDGDGATALVDALGWLRKQGVDIRSTAAHNSPLVYGSECFEVFEGLSVAGREQLDWQGRQIKLQTLNQSALGLTFEGNHPRVRAELSAGRMAAITRGSGDCLRQPEWQKAYFLDNPIFERGYEYDAWLIGQDRWVLSGEGEIDYPLTLDELLLKLEGLPEGSRLVASVHPIYVGLREGDTLAPPPPITPSVPENFGFWWEKEESDLNWYDWMFQTRLRVHRHFVDWVNSKQDRELAPKSVLEVGCGRGVFFPHFFSDRAYTGLEFSKRNTQWLEENRVWPGHTYEQGDIAEWASGEKYDLVFSSGTIDNVPDMDAFLAGMVRASKRWIYLTAYRGWFPDLQNHTITWQEETGAYYNDISPTRVRELLVELGCADIVIEPLETGREDIPLETLIIARVPQTDG